MSSLRIVLVVSGVVLLGGVIIWSRYVRPQQNAAACRVNMKALATALASYHETYESFPAAYSNNGNRSWRVDVLPSLGEAPLYAQYDHAGAWDSSANSRLLSKRPRAFRCPSSSDSTTTPFQAVVGVQSAWPFSNAIRMRDFHDGVSNTIQVVENHNPEVPWTSPSDTRWHDLSNGPVAGPHSTDERGTSRVVLADGSVRTISAAIDVEIWRALLSPQGGRPIQGMDWSDLDAAQMSELVGTGGKFAKPVASSTLPATRMLPSADEPLHRGENMIYCPTFALAWQRYCELMPQTEPTKFAQRLKDIRFRPSDIHTDDIQVFAGRGVTNDIEVYREAAGFGADDMHIADTDMLPVAYCALKKELPFIAEFEPFENPLLFDSGDGPVSVRSFGVTSNWNEWGKALGQVQVLKYGSPDDFVIRIGNLAGEDLILAKIPQPTTLEDGLRRLQATIKDSGIRADARAVVSGEQLVVPVLEMSLLEDFTGQLNHPSQPEGLRVLSARQKIQFRLNESGAKLLSEAAVIGEYGHYEYKVGERTFIFDKPFLVVLRESGDKQPYFAAWIANSDLMLPPR